MNILSKNILRLRNEAKLSQTQLGEKIGYSQRTISDWEKGNTEPNIDAVRKLVKVFEISYEELLD